MNEQIPTSEPKPVKPCRKCGEVDRTKSGACRSCQKQAVLRYQSNNPDKVKVTAKKYYDQNKSKRVSAAYAWSRQNPDKFKTNMARWREKNHEYLKLKRREWEKKNPEKIKHMRTRGDHNRRFRLLANGGNLSVGIIEKLLNAQKGKCACCGLSLNNGYHLDHIIPLALGGKNTDDNVQLLTPKCNLKKGAKHPIDYMQSKGLLL